MKVTITLNILGDDSVCFTEAVGKALVEHALMLFKQKERQIGDPTPIVGVAGEQMTPWATIAWQAEDG